MDKTSWQRIITNNYELPSQPSLAQLSNLLLSYLGSTDAELRETIAYPIFADLTFVDEKPPRANELLPLVEDALRHIRVWC